MRADYSVIVTSYYEEKSIDEFIGRVLKVMRDHKHNFEIIMVNDGSTDKTFERQTELFKNNEEITHLVDLFRNSGQLAAMSCGITHATGKNYVFIDSDLQLAPEELPNLIAEVENGYDIVSGTRASRAEGIFRTIPSRIANYLMKKIARHPISDFGCTYKIYNAKIVDAFGFGPNKAWKTAFVFKAAGTVKEVTVTQKERKYGKSGWTLRKLTNFLFDHVVGISSRPFLMLTLFSLLFGAAILFRILISFIFPGGILSDITMGLVLNFILISTFVTLSCFAITGEFIFRVFQMTEDDPIYIEKTHFWREDGKVFEE